MKLVIFPGGGSPSNETYRKVYGLLERKALSYGYDSIDSSIRWPGHSEIDGGDPGGRLTLDGALKVACEKVRDFEKQGTEYHILGRSFGTIVAASLAIKYEPNNLKKLILWGSPSYWLAWKLCKRDLAAFSEKSRTKGCYFDESYFSSLAPIEALLKDLKYSTVLATGEKDIYCPPAFHHYLKAMYGDSSHLDFNSHLIFREPVKGAAHEVTEDIGEKIVTDYLEALFT